MKREVYNHWPVTSKGPGLIVRSDDREVGQVGGGEDQSYVVTAHSGACLPPLSTEWSDKGCPGGDEPSRNKRWVSWLPVLFVILCDYSCPDDLLEHACG